MAESTVRVLFLGNSASAVRSVNTLGRSFGGLGSAARLATRAVGIGLGGALLAATKSAVDLDAAMRNVNSIAKLSEAQLGRLTKQVLALAKETGQAPKTLADGLYDIVSSGFAANDAVKILRVSAKAATAGLTDTATATRAVNAALNAYHLRAGDARQVSDVLFQTVNKGVITFEELAQNMGDLVPAAAPLGVSLEEVGAAIATITLQGVPAAEAATRVKNTMLQLARPSEQLAKLLNQQGFESGEAAIKAKGFVGVLRLLDAATKGSVTRTAALTPEIRALLGVVGLTGKNFKTYRDNLKSMGDATEGAGATAEAFAEQGKSISLQWQKARAALTAALIPIGQLLFPLLAQGADKAAAFAATIESSMPQIRAQFAGLASTLSGLVPLVEAVARGFTSDLGLALAGGATVVYGFIRAAVGLRESLIALKATLLTVNPVFTALGVILGVVAANYIYGRLKTDEFAEATKRAKAALDDLVGSADEAAQADLDLASAKAASRQANLAAGDAQRAYNKAVREGGKHSREARRAEANLESARAAQAQAAHAVEQAEERTANAHDRQRKANERARKSVAGLTADFADLTAKAQHAADVVSARTGHALDTLSDKARDKALATFADDAAALADKASRAAAQLAKTNPALSRTAQNAADAAAAASALVVQLGRIPTSKEVSIFIREIHSSDRIEQQRVGRAAGGFIPRVAGATPGRDSVPAMLTPGELVLNRAQQHVLGGPRFLAGLFGFSGREGPGFAAGGIVGHATGVEGLETQYGLLQRLFGLPRSEAGEGFGPHEVARLVGNRRRLIRALQGQRRRLRRRLRTDEGLQPFDRRELRRRLSAIPFAISSARLDIRELLQGSRAAAAGPNVEDLLAQIGQLKLALGIQGAQSQVLGQFQHGVRFVPKTGLALLHRGEQVVSAPDVARRTMGGDGATVPPLEVYVQLQGDIAALKPKIDAWVKSPATADYLSRQVGVRATTRRRAGRF